MRPAACRSVRTLLAAESRRGGRLLTLLGRSGAHSVPPDGYRAVAMPDLRAAFDWFEQSPPRKGDGVLTIPMALESLWGEVQDAVGPERFDETLGQVRAGQRFGAEDDHAWVQTHGEQDEATVNLTIELYANELTLNLVGFFDGQFDKVRGWIARGSGRAFLRSHPELELVIFVRTARRGKGGRVMWKGARSEERGRLALSEESPAAISIRLTTLRRQIDPDLQKLALHVRRGWSRQEAEAMADASEIAALVEDWIEELPSVQLGGEPRQW